MRVHKPKRRQRRSDRRFRPGPWCNGRELEPGLELEARVLLSARAAAMSNARHARAPGRLTPYAEINKQYSTFMSDFTAVENLYVTSINEESSGKVTVTTTVAANYPSTTGTGLIQVSNASVFFPNGSTTPVTATATSGNFLFGYLYLTGYIGNTLSVAIPPRALWTCPRASPFRPAWQPAARPAPRASSPASLPIVPTRWPSTWCNTSTACR